MIQIDWEPSGAWSRRPAPSRASTTTGSKATPKRFKEFIESRGGDETGAWRGEVDADVTGGGRA